MPEEKKFPAFHRVINPYKKRDYEGGKLYDVFFKITFDEEGALSISGVEGPMKNGDCYGGCGQIIMSMRDEDMNTWSFYPEFDQEKLCKFMEIWDRWHLNDLRAECSHQRERGETYETHPSVVCPQCGWKLGHAWCKEEVPHDVLLWLLNLPRTKNRPAWV